MTNKRHTRRALLAAFMALVMCCSMFVGTTFAWFTDTAKTGVNIIQAGKLDIQLLDAEGKKSVEGKSLSFVKANNSEEEVLWEPGATYYTEGFTIKNGGNLHLKFKVVINGISTGNAKLLEAIDFYLTSDAATPSDILEVGKEYNLAPQMFFDGENAGGAEEPTVLYLAGHMKEEAGNEYQGLSLEGVGITLVATQLNAESDSFGPDYDIDAIYPGYSAGADLSGLNGVYEDKVLTTLDANPIVVTLPADLVGSLATGKSVTEVTVAATSIEAVEVEGNIVVSYDDVSLIDQNGNVVDLSDNTLPISVKLYVGTEYADKTAVVSHDGEIVATGAIDADGYINYSTTHFCEITVDILGDGEDAPEVVLPTEPEEGEEIDSTEKVQMLIGSHYYTVSYGLSQSWSEKSASAGTITSDIYIPEDLLAYSMAYRNGDLATTGNHSTLTLVNDLDFTGINWAPIGRFYTDIVGGGKKLSNLNDSLFGCVYDCKISGLTLENVTASGSASGVIAKELAGDIFISDVIIAGTNTVSYVNDGASNWPEGGTGVGAICGVSLIAYKGYGAVDVTVTGSITVNYNGIMCGNTTNLVNLGVCEDFGLNVYMKNQNAKVTVAEGGSIITEGTYYEFVSDGLYVSDSTNYMVINANGLEMLNKKFADKSAGQYVNVELANDIDFTGKTWTPVDSHADTAFYLTSFNGNGHTISNLTVNGQAMFKRFAGSGDVTIKDVTFDNATVNSNGTINTSILTVQTYQNVLLDNVDVKNSSITGGYKVAPLIATVYNEGASTVTATLKNCDVSNTTVTATAYDFCTTGMVAFVYASDNDKIEFENCTVDNVKIYAPDDSYDAHAWIYTTGSGSLFNEAEGVTVTNCSFENK